MHAFHKLWTKTAYAKVPLLYATEDIPADDKVARVKIFSIRDDQRWYVLEYDPETGKAFCLHTNRGESSLGYSVINDPGEEDHWGGEDMQALNKRMPMLPPFERDSSFTTATVGEIKAKLAEGIAA